ncbi:MAG: sigma-70 family RNA polymerase sigma factor [Lachnospiraceae bacterium]
MEESTVLIERLQAGDKEAREVLIEKNLGLVHHIVKRFSGRGVDMEDLFQIGTIGLMKAIDKFDLSFGVKFSTYAVPLISGEIKRFLRDDGLVKVSRSLKENGWKVNRALEHQKREKGTDMTLEELAKATGLNREEIIMAMEANIQVESLYKSVYQSDGSEIYLVDQVVAGGGESGLGREVSRSPEGRIGCFGAGEDREKEELLNRILLEQLLENLGDSERNLIKMRYFENMTQVQVARILGISQVQVSRTEKKILQGMRKNLE